MHESQAAIFVLLAIIFFMAPTWLAARGRRWSVGLVNVLFGWTIIGWGIALIMAVRSQEQALNKPYRKGGIDGPNV
jgi:hypothetical protein